MPSRLRLRQLCTVVRDLPASIVLAKRSLDAPQCFVDDRVGYFGAANSVHTLGNQFLELLTPTRADSPSGRFLERHGEGGYVVVLEALDDSLGPDAFAALDIRIAHQFRTSDYAGWQLHPKDCGGLFIEIGRQQAGRCDDGTIGAWMPADSPGSRALPVSAPRLDQIVVATDDPASAGERIAVLAGSAAVADGDAVDVPLDLGRVTFVMRGAERPAGIVGAAITLTGTGGEESTTAGRVELFGLDLRVSRPHDRDEAGLR